MKKLIGATAICLGLLLAVPSQAADGIRQERVHFQKGKDSATLRGSIQGDETVDYKLGAKAGQTMDVTLKSNNGMNYFNVLPPGSEEAIFIGSTSGNHFVGALPQNGDYTVRVYLMRAGARRNESADYRLNVSIKGASQAATGGDFADGDAGGPDFWEVQGVADNDVLNLRTQPSAKASTVVGVPNGTVLRNHGCKRPGGQRWCQVSLRDDESRRGWVAGRYLREASRQ